MSNKRLGALRVVDPVLTALAVGFTNAALVGDQLFPFVNLDKEGGKIPLFGKEHFKLYNTERALRANSNRISPEDIGDVDVAMDEHDLEYPIDYREEAESAFPLQARATNIVVEAIRLRHERMVADMALDPARYPAGNKIALSGASCWSDLDADIEGQIDDAKAAVRAKIVKEPNTMILSAESYRLAKRNRGLRAILSDNGKRLVTLADMREIFEVENIVVGRAVQSSDAGVVSDIWGDNCVLAYVPGAGNTPRSPYEPSFGYTLRKKGQPTVDSRLESGGKLELIRNTDIFRPFLLGADAGYLISNTRA